MRKVAIDIEASVPGELHLTIDPDGPKPERVVMYALPGLAMQNVTALMSAMPAYVCHTSKPSAVGKSEILYRVPPGEPFSEAYRLLRDGQALPAVTLDFNEDDPKVKDLRRRISLARAKRDRRTETMLTKELNKIWGKS